MFPKLPWLLAGLLALQHLRPELPQHLHLGPGIRNLLPVPLGVLGLSASLVSTRKGKPRLGAGLGGGPAASLVPRLPW